jgi:hypothetical protein
MSIKLRLIVCLAILLLSAATAPAGLYCPDSQNKEELNKDVRVFLETYFAFKNIPNSSLDTPLRQKALLVEQMAPALDPETMTETQFLNVSAYLIRLNRHTDAIDLLNEGTARFKDNFLLQANLGTAYFLASGGADEDLLGRAFDFLKEAYKNWPAQQSKLTNQQQLFLSTMGWQFGVDLLPGTVGFAACPVGQGPLLAATSIFSQRGWSPKYNHYRTAEKHHSRLVFLRKLEALKQNKITSSLKKRDFEKNLNVDALFTDSNGAALKFVGPSGKYEPGKLAASELDKLPNRSVDEAILIVEQLLLWMPLDDRLYWQLGELVNARGSVKDAETIFKMMVEVATPPPLDELKDHYRILKEYLPPKDQNNQVANNQQEAAQDKKAGASTNGEVTENLADRWLFFGVGLGTGLLLAFFGYWQVRMLFRRRQRRQPEGSAQRT